MITHKTFLLMFISTVGLLSKSSSGQENVNDAFEKAKIVPDAITKAPKEKANVIFKSGVQANLGNSLTPTQVKDEPVVTWKTEPGSLYTLVMVDLDAPTPQNNSQSEIRHWLIVNIPRVNIPRVNIKQGKVITKYLQSMPPKESDPHRYVILVYKQNRILNLDPDNKSRTKFSIKDFAIMNGLNYPVAGNFYKAAYDGSYSAPPSV